MDYEIEIAYISIAHIQTGSLKKFYILLIIGC